MTLRSQKVIPVALCGLVLLGIVAIETLNRVYENVGPFHRLELMSFDWRVREAAKSQPTAATDVGLVYINESSIWYLRSGRAGYDIPNGRFEAGLYWPRYVYGQAVNELRTQGASVIGFDVLLPDLRRDHQNLLLPDGSSMVSDAYFVEQIREAGNVILAAEKDVIPPDWFRTNAWTIGDIGAQRDVDGVLRRTKAFVDYVIWNPDIHRAAELFNIRYDTNRIEFAVEGGPVEVIPIEPNGAYDRARLYELGNGRQWPAQAKRTGQAFTRQRVWDLGIAMAARHLEFNLADAEIIPGSQIVLRGTNGNRREIPIDRENRFYIDWSMQTADPALTREALHSLLFQHYARASGRTNDIVNRWKGKLALVGSIATGNDLTDVGATPLLKEDFLTSRYLNVANSLLLGRFVRQPSHAIELALIIGLGLFSGVCTWNFRAAIAAGCVVLLGGVYFSLGLYLYTSNRYWLPLVFPTAALVLTHMTLVTYRVIVEQKERRRIRNIFSKIVSPNVVNELLDAEKLSTEGARREITVFFSDVRGFTEMTDESHALAEEHVRQEHLSADEADAYFDEQAQEVLRTVNLYLGTIADVVKKHEGTLDKYIGDCVMAFWGAPTPNEKHAVTCVRAAIDAQRAIDGLNKERAVENQRRQLENIQRSNQRLPLLPALRLLAMGTGINTGIVTIGLMGSERHIYNFTVFGREVNLASRLEGLSGRGRILIGEATYQEVQRDDPALAATCRELEPAHVKGFRTSVKVYEVPWKTDEAEPVPPPHRSNTLPLSGSPTSAPSSASGAAP